MVEVNLKQVEERLAELSRSLEDEKAKVVEKEVNIATLKKNLTVMDEQIQDFEAILRGADQKEFEFEFEFGLCIDVLSDGVNR